jgi:hypothetical protein
VRVFTPTEHLLQAEGQSKTWRDAGMISLGFFRILELEFNERLLLPAMKAVDIEMLISDLAALSSGVSQGAHKKAVEFWQKMMPSLKRAKKDGKGLELGSLELLLQKVVDTAGVDSALKARINSALCQRLTNAGVEAFKSGELASLLNEEAREKYRNPPAHSRYLDLATARACRTYVSKALERLIFFTSDLAHPAPTIH